MHFEFRPKDFNAFWSRPGFIFTCFMCLFLFIFIYFYLFPLIFIDSLVFFDFHVFFMFLFRVCRKRIAPPLPKHVGFKNANRTRKLENRIVSFFFPWGVESRSFHPSDRIFHDFVTGKITFFGFSLILQFWEAPSRHFPEIWSPAQGFWSPAKGF